MTHYGRGWFVAQVVAWLLLATVLVASYVRLASRFDIEARARAEQNTRLLEQVKALQLDNRQLIMGLSDFIECVALRAIDRPQPAPISACRVYLVEGG